MYRNAVYNNRTQSVRLFTWDTGGKRIAVDASFCPYLYVEDVNGTDVSIYNTKLKKKIFPSGYERYKFVKESGVKRLFENLSPVQQFLTDCFWRDNEKDEFTEHPLKTVFIDIETYRAATAEDGEESGFGGFPDVNDPKHPINVITCYDTLSKRYHTFGTSPFTSDRSDVVYKYCKSEKELFTKLIEYFEADYPDILSGWSSEQFDIPYIINRCERVLGEEYVRRLSPVGKVSFRMVVGRFGRDFKKWSIEGISCIDYLDIYRKFCLTMRESYKLDSIAELELGERKIDYGNVDLATLADRDWKTFVDYNIKDVALLVMLEEKLQYVSLLRMLAYTGLTTFEGALGSISMLMGALTIKARNRNRVMSTFVRSDKNGQIPGAYVSEPIRGIQSNVVSFDAASLYPSIMISLNMSPETKIGSYEKDSRGNIQVYHISGKTFEMTPEKFAQFLKTENCAISEANIIFSQKHRGIVSEFLDENFKKRVETRKLLSQVNADLSVLDKSSKDYRALKFRSQMLDTKQLTQKIILNSLYGSFANKHSPYGDDDIASSVTLTGQAIIKQAQFIIREYFKTDIEDLTSGEYSDCIIYGDTDSFFISITPYIKRGYFKLLDGDIISDEVYSKLKQIEVFVDTEINNWVKQTLNAGDSRIHFKREKICDVGMFLQKKRYVVNILDNEGIKTNKFKYVGVEVNRTSMPNTIKPYAKRIIETMLTTQSQPQTTKIFTEAYDKIKVLPHEDISFVMGVKDYEKSAVKCNKLNIGKSVPIHARAAYLHNYMNRVLGIQNKYEDIGSGDKVRFFYVQQPNKYGISAIGFKNVMPEEYRELFKIDYEKMFEKILFNSIERFYDNVGWRIRKPSEAVKTDLFELFS